MSCVALADFEKLVLNNPTFVIRGKSASPIGDVAQTWRKRASSATYVSTL